MHGEMKILVIEDNEVTSSIVKEQLEREGFNVQTCHSAFDAIFLSEEHRFDVYVIDYRLPDYHGDTVTGLIRGMQPSAIIIGYSIEPKEQAFLAAGADKFIFKERLTAELIAFIRQVPDS